MRVLAPWQWESRASGLTNVDFRAWTVDGKLRHAAYKRPATAARQC